MLVVYGLPRMLSLVCAYTIHESYASYCWQSTDDVAQWHRRSSLLLSSPRTLHSRRANLPVLCAGFTSGLDLQCLSRFSRTNPGADLSSHLHQIQLTAACCLAAWRATVDQLGFRDSLFDNETPRCYRYFCRSIFRLLASMLVFWKQATFTSPIYSLQGRHIYLWNTLNHHIICTCQLTRACRVAAPSCMEARGRRSTARVQHCASLAVRTSAAACQISGPSPCLWLERTKFNKSG